VRYDSNESVVDKLYYCNDANMNVTALVNAADGDVEERYHYDPYGKVTFLDEDFEELVSQASQFDNCVLFAGYIYDKATGLYCARYRYYEPPLGRWLTRDPFNQNMPGGGYQDGMNLYQYVRSAPLMAIDPTGRVTEEEARATLEEQIEDWKGKGWILAPHLMAYFLKTKEMVGIPVGSRMLAPDYIPTEEDRAHVKKHARPKILSKVVDEVALQMFLLNKRLGNYDVSITHPGKTNLDSESNIRWGFEWDDFDDDWPRGGPMFAAYGGADLNVQGSATIDLEYQGGVPTAVRAKGTLDVRLGDLYTFKKGWLRERDKAYRHAAFLEHECGYKPFYHEMTLQLHVDLRYELGSEGR
jgi:RHS repeat-associated protein